MHDTHTRALTHVPTVEKRLHRSRKRPQILILVYQRWVFLSLLALYFQFCAGVVRAEEGPGSGVLMLQGQDGQIAAIQLDADIDLLVQGLLAEMTLKQSFQNTFNQWVEGSYLFPLPPDATIRGLRIETAGRLIEGIVKPRAEATQVYEAAKATGKIAAVIEQQRPNLFTMKVANIAPGDTIDVTLDIMLPVGVTNKRMVINLPTTLTPRYTNSDTVDAVQLDSPFVQPSQLRGPRLKANISIEPIADYSKVSSSTHELNFSEQGIQLNDIPMDRDLILSWPVPFENKARTHAFVSKHNNQRYVQLLVNPPEAIDEQLSIGRELILIIDKSGSMAGVSMNSAKQALQFAIDELKADDYFNIVAFDDKTYPMFSTSLPASDAQKNKARRFIDRLQADGGTEMNGALSFAIQSNTNDDLDDDSPKRLRQIVFMTDGSVGYEDALLARIKRQLGNNRLFTVGIGPAPNTWFLEKAAEAGRGVALSIQDEQDVANSITQLLTRLANPVLTDLAVQYANGQGEIYPKPLPDLYADRPGMWISRISDEVEQMIVTGYQGTQRYREIIALPDANSGAGAGADADADPSVDIDTGKSIAPAVAMHWTRSKIDSLLDEQRYAVDNEMHKQTITRLAVDVGLVTRYTSFVAVEPEPVRPASATLATHKVANLIPAGNEMLNVAMPQGAAGADTLAALSLLLGLSGAGLFGWARARVGT